MTNEPSHTSSTACRSCSHTYERKRTETNSPVHRSTARRQPEFALIRNVSHQRNQSSKSHAQIPASLVQSDHRQKQQFGSSRSAFRPIQSLVKHKRASSEGHSPSTPSSPASSVSSSNSSLNVQSQSSKRRRLSCDLPVPLFCSSNTNSLTRSVCNPSSLSTSVKINPFSRTMSDILCDQFSELNLDAIEQDSLIQQQHPSKPGQGTFTIVKDYRSSRASFAVRRGDCVHVLKHVGRACVLVRKQASGQIGFLPRALIAPATSTRIDTFLEMHGYRETII